MASPAPRETCPGCGFEWAVIDTTEVGPRILASVDGFADALAGPNVTTRPEPARWSTVEYAAHTRDVLLTLRDRIILAVVEECPSPPPLYRDHRVALGLYAAETADSARADLAMAGRLFTTAFGAIAPEHAARTLIYSQLLGEERTIGWTGAQALHECEHHLGDVRENARLLGAR